MGQGAFGQGLDDAGLRGGGIGLGCEVEQGCEWEGQRSAGWSDMISFFGSARKRHVLLGNEILC